MALCIWCMAVQMLLTDCKLAVLWLAFPVLLFKSKFVLILCCDVCGIIPVMVY